MEQAVCLFSLSKVWGLVQGFRVYACRVYDIGDFKVYKGLGFRRLGFRAFAWEIHRTQDLGYSLGLLLVALPENHSLRKGCYT